MFDVFSGIVLIAEIFLLVPVLYLLLLTWAARQAPKQTRFADKTLPVRFLILIPAHNEEKLLPACLENVLQCDYPKDLYAVHVIADNCTDRTSEIAKGHGVSVHERTNEQLRGKGYALRWVVERLSEILPQYDGVVVLDADTVISTNFLKVMAARLASGERVIQAFYSVHSPEQSPTSSLRYAALAVLHYLRPQGRMVFGGSAGLKGNGMVFTPETLVRHTWPASLTEDIEYHMQLLLAGERVTFAPDAVVWGQIPVTLAQSRSQHDRWERGRLEMARRFVPQLMTEAWRALKQSNRLQAYIFIDAVMEHLIPPFSILLAMTFLTLFAGLALLIISLFSGQASLQITSTEVMLPAANTVLAIGLLVGQSVYLLCGLLLVRAPAKIYRSLLFAPIFILWKIWQYFRVSLSRDQHEWIRTARNEG